MEEPIIEAAVHELSKKTGLSMWVGSAFRCSDRSVDQVLRRAHLLAEFTNVVRNYGQHDSRHPCTTRTRGSPAPGQPRDPHRGRHRQLRRGAIVDRISTNGLLPRRSWSGAFDIHFSHQRRRSLTTGRRLSSRSMWLIASRWTSRRSALICRRCSDLSCAVACHLVCLVVHPPVRTVATPVTDAPTPAPRRAARPECHRAQQRTPGAVRVSRGVAGNSGERAENLRVSESPGQTRSAYAICRTGAPRIRSKSLGRTLPARQ